MCDLTAVAFGADPGRWPLPAASTATDLWLRAVAAGGQGRYASALTDLDSLARASPGGTLTSLAFSTRASFLRQLGGHGSARAWDGRAWRVAGSDVIAQSDALVGLAADALGVGRFALSAQLLSRARDCLNEGTTDTAAYSPGGSGRLPVRLAWVSAELAMFTGEGATAVRHADRAAEVASRLYSARHLAKSHVVLAAALCSAGDASAARRVADDALETTENLGLIPLSWALTCLLADIGSATHPPPHIAAVRDRLAEAVRHRGGPWTAR